jgi:hypothetical protein
MAARMPAAPETVDLRRLLARDLEPLLAEETEEWLGELEWDFAKSAAMPLSLVVDGQIGNHVPR